MLKDLAFSVLILGPIATVVFALFFVSAYGALTAHRASGRPPSHRFLVLVAAASLLFYGATRKASSLVLIIGPALVWVALSAAAVRLQEKYQNPYKACAVAALGFTAGLAFILVFLALFGRTLFPEMY